MAYADFTPAHWLQIFPQLSIDGAAKNIASHSVVDRVEDKQLLFILDEAQSALFNDSQRVRLEGALQEYFDLPLSVKVTVGQFENESPARYKNRRIAERQHEAEQAIAADPFVALLQEHFDASVIADSIKPKIDE